MHRSTFSPLQDANPTPSFGGFGLSLGLPNKLGQKPLYRLGALHFKRLGEWESPGARSSRICQEGDGVVDSRSMPVGQGTVSLLRAGPPLLEASRGGTDRQRERRGCDGAQPTREACSARHRRRGEREGCLLAGVLAIGGNLRPGWSATGDLHETIGSRTPSHGIGGGVVAATLAPLHDHRLPRVPRRAQPWMAAIVRTVDQKQSPEEVHAQRECLGGMLKECFPKAAEFLCRRRARRLGFLRNAQESALAVQS